MKIYPGRHSIVKTQEVNKESDIPLAYISMESAGYVLNVTADINFSTPQKKEVLPYSIFDSRDIVLFDENNSKIDSFNHLTNIGQQYQYAPPETISFYPQRFNYSVTGKKTMLYKNNRTYNLKVACDDDSNLTLSKKLIRVFGDAAKRNICPSNIFVNNEDIAVESLINSSQEENDFVFISSPDGKKYTGTTQAIDINSYLDKNTNVWLSIEDNDIYKVFTSSESLSYSMKSSTAINIQEYKSSVYFDTQKILQATTNSDGTILHNLFVGNNCPVLLIEYPQRGFVIYSHKSFVDNIEANVNLLYEILMYVYFNTYITTAKINEWITDTVPDYVVSNGRLFLKDKFTSSMELHKMFGLEPSEIMLSKITIDAPNIVSTGLASNYIVFQKVPHEKYADPIKPADKISIFTEKQNVVFFDKFIYEIIDSIEDKISTSIQNNNIRVFIKPFRHSRKGINIESTVDLTIPLIKTIDYKETKVLEANYYIYCKNNMLLSIDASEYKNEMGTIISTIVVRQSEKTSKVYDMRQRGGGLPEDAPDNYDMLDIGHIYGRPYRKAGTLVITLPKRLEPHKDLITAAVEKHIIAQEFPIIIFED